MYMRYGGVQNRGLRLIGKIFFAFFFSTIATYTPFTTTSAWGGGSEGAGGNIAPPIFL